MTTSDPPSYVFDRTDKGDQLACACLAKLLVEGFCEGLSTCLYFSEAVKQFRAEFGLDCFLDNIPVIPNGTNEQHEWCGVLSSQEALRSLLDHSTISANLQPKCREENQLVALYVLRGLSHSELLAAVSIDEYVSALHRHPHALFGAWFERDAALHAELNTRLAHCAAATGKTVCLRACGGDLWGWSAKCQVDELLTSDGSTLLHTAASHGSAEVLKYLLRKGFSADARNN